MQIQDVLNGQQALFTLSQKALPAKTAYRIGKAINQSRSVAKTFEKARYDMIVSIEGVTISDDGKSFNIEGKEDQVEAGIKKLLETDCPVTFFPVSLADLGNIEIEPMHLAALDGWILTENETLAEEPTI